MTNYIPATLANRMIRKVLKEAYPNVKFKVYHIRPATYVAWDVNQPGPSRLALAQLLWPFQGVEYSDHAMTYIDREVELDGARMRFGTRYIHCNNGLGRDHPDSAEYPQNPSPTIERFSLGSRTPPF